MFGPLGVWEIAVIMVLALLIFGPKKLPEVGRTIGRGLGEFRRATTDLKRTIEREIDFDETKPAPVTRPASRLPAGPEASLATPPSVDAATAAGSPADGPSAENASSSDPSSDGLDPENGGDAPSGDSTASKSTASESTPGEGVTAKAAGAENVS